MERNVVFQINEVKTVADVEGKQVSIDRIKHQDTINDSCLRIIVLQFIVIRQRDTVGIEQAIRAFVPIHLEAPVVRGEDTLLVAISFHSRCRA